MMGNSLMHTTIGYIMISMDHFLLGQGTGSKLTCTSLLFLSARGIDIVGGLLNDGGKKLSLAFENRRVAQPSKITQGNGGPKTAHRY